MSGGDRADARACGLAAEFWEPVASLGNLRPVSAADVPRAFRDLLDHTNHMTVAMEQRHGGPVSVRVLNVKRQGPSGYAREILLLDPRGTVVQYGIVRIDLSAVQPETAAAIVAGTAPLGRILIDAGVLRDVHDVELLEVVPGSRLAGLFAVGNLADAPRTFGRVADIAVDQKPAVELLEIAAPR